MPPPISHSASDGLIPTAAEILSFQKLYAEHAGITIGPEEAKAMLADLAQFFILTGGPQWIRQRNQPK